MPPKTKKAVRKVTASQVRAREEHEEEIPISQLGTRSRRAPSPTPALAPLEPNYSPVAGNVFLFRNDNAHCYYVAFNKRPQAECHYYIKNGVLQEKWESEKATEYVSKWDWKPLLECIDPYPEIVVRAFYANIEKFPKGHDPWGFKTYVCGRELEITLPNVANWLNLKNEGEEIYLNKSWLKNRNAPTPEDYLKWFGAPDNITAKDGRFHVTVLPSLHRLGFAFLNHILTPKGGKKTTMEYNQMFYLRHLIDGSNRKFNIPFVIISHMLAAYSDRQRVLPYGNLIAKILRANGVDLSQAPQLIWPTNLWNNLESHGWDLVDTDLETGAKIYKRKDTPINHWIAEPNALPNQYTDPKLGQSQGHASGSSSQSAQSIEFQKSVLESLSKIIQTQAKHTEEIELLKANYNGFNKWARGSYRGLYEDHKALKSRFIVRFGPDDDDDDAGSPSASQDDGGDDGGDDDPMQS